jgi:hypothetical protein
MALLRPVPLLALAFAAGACARSVPVTTNGQVAPRSQSVARFSGTLKAPTLSSPSTISKQSTGATATAYGSVMLTRIAEVSDRWRYEVTVTSPPSAGGQLAWALYSGTCGASTPPVVPTNELAPLDLNSAGTGMVRGEFGALLEPNGTYHVNVYFGARATDVNNVMLCTRLGFSGKP